MTAHIKGETVETHVQMAGYVMATVVGLWAVASLMSPGLVPDTMSAWITLTGLALGLVLSAWWKRLRPIVVPVAVDRHTPAAPRNGV